MKLPLLILLAFTLPAPAALITPVQNSSTVGITGFGGYYVSPGQMVSSNYAHSSVPDAALLDTIYMSVPFLPILANACWSSASQTSSISADHIEANGAVDTYAGLSPFEHNSDPDHFPNGWSSSATAISTFDFLFQITEPTFYHLVGSLDNPWWGGGGSDISLSLQGGTSLIDIPLPVLFSGHREFNLAGLLGPGMYQLNATAHSGSSGGRESGEGWASFSFMADFAPATASSIVIHPRSRTNVVGSSLMLSVTANGTEPLTYQWYKEGGAILGATGRTYVLANVQSTNAGSYRVKVTDLGGFSLSSNAQVTVVPVKMPAVIGGPVINPANGHEYYLLAQSTWVEAEAQAQALGGHLATLRNAAEQEWVFTNFSTWGGVQRNLWIGFHDADPVNNATNRIDRQAEFVWASGEPVVYTNWNAGEPNNYRELGEFYVHTLSPSLITGAGTWNDTWDSDVNGLPIHGVVECDVTVVYLSDKREVGVIATAGTSIMRELELWELINYTNSFYSVPLAPFRDFNLTNSARAQVGGDWGGLMGFGFGVAGHDSILRPNGFGAELGSAAWAGMGGDQSPTRNSRGACSSASRFNISFALLDRHDCVVFGEIFAFDESLSAPTTLVSSLRLKNASLGVLYSAAAQPPDFPHSWWESSFSFSNANVLPAGIYSFDGEASADAHVARYAEFEKGNSSISLKCGLTAIPLTNNALVFNNYSAARWSPVFGPEPGNPRLFKQGNSTNGLPAGTQVYGGLPLTGTNWTVELWGTTGEDQPEAALQFQARTCIQALTEAEKSFWGMFLAGTVELVGIPDDQSATFQVRVYDGRGGTVTSWSAVLEEPTVMRGWSERLNVTAAPVRTLEGLQSFNMHVPANPVGSAPIVYAQPADIVATQGDDVTFSPVILGAQPLTYHWFFRDSPLSGGNAETLLLENIHLAADGPYFLLVSNAYGMATSRVATLTVRGPVTIAGQPLQQVVPLGGTAFFNVTANGNPAPTYQWLFNGAALPGANLSNLIITNVDTNNLGGYSVIAWNPYSAATSSVALLLMSPSIRSPFLGDTFIWGRSATLSASAVGSGDLSYQWFRNGEAILWGTNSTLVFSAVQINDAGLYSVVVSSVWGSVTNPPAPLVVNPANISLAMYAGVTIEGVPGFNYGIQYTTDLRDTNAWTTITNLTLAAPVETWVDLDSAGKPRRYYRVVAQ